MPHVDTPRGLDDPRHLAIVGLMGSGKTTVGKLVAARLHRPFVDSDAMVEREFGETVRQMQEAGGTAAVRAAETRVLREAFGRRQPSVVAAAAGTVLDPANRVHLQECLTVWLRAPARVLAQRATGPGGGHRPFLEETATAEATFEQMQADRSKLFEAVADLTLDAGTATPVELAGRIVGWFEGAAQPGSGGAGG